MKKFLVACGRVLKSPWTLLVLAVCYMVLDVLYCMDLGSEFRIESWFFGVIFGLGIECFGDAFAQLLPPPKEKE